MTARERAETVVLLFLILATGAAGWKLLLAPDLSVDAAALASFPVTIGRWRATEIPLDATVERILRADFHIQRAYHAAASEPVWLYIGYYGTARGGRPDHTPRGCYTGAGWGITESRTIEVDPVRGLRANEYHVERDGEHRLVLFWYRSHRGARLLGGFDQNVDRLIGRLFDRRADGALIRLSTRMPPEGDVAARGRLLAFANLIEPLLAAHWPEELHCGPRAGVPCPPTVVTQISQPAASRPAT